MKTFVFLLAICVSFIIELEAQNIKGANSNTKLLIYYFHITNRCNTCRSIEATTKKILETQYANELKKGIIVFESINCELSENKKLVEKYQAYGATLALTPIVNGKEAGIEDITGMAFSKIRNEEAFTNELTSKIDQYLK